MLPLRWPQVDLAGGFVRLETTPIYAQIRPAQLKRAVAFYEAKALDALAGEAKK